MHRTLTVLGVLLLFAVNAAPQGKSKSWLRGAWEGTGYQTDDQSTWPMKLTIKGRRTFSIDYPSLNCGGRWKLLNIIGSKARFREELDRGQDKCTDHGLVVLERVNRRQLLYWYSLQDSNQITASAVLNRKKPAGNH